ncbi:hypothetical protein A0H76_1773 [Hepatospora eriocheir]|uniref:Uncharacterized protein n=1 Tax=Hepatospora eriocheir TaxID=1081669 RepID=A0A1X0QGI4_9MICR|nr:hypothetical protein A0H76_1773 [Hepatospora eriocheir]
MLITPPFWINNYEEYFEGKDKLEVNGDLECILVEEVSFVDVSYKEKIYKIPYSVYMGCLTNNNDSVEYLEIIILKK